MAKKNSLATEFTTELGGKKLTITTGKLATQAMGSCTVQYGDTVILATAVMAKETREEVDFFPLTIEYEERLYAAGKIKGSRFIKREGRPSDEAVLVGRFIDRGLRPLFPDWLRNEVQIIVTVLSVDQENEPDVISIIGASAALAISGIPWDGPVGGLRLGRINGEWVINPSYEALAKSDLDLVLTGTDKHILMIECGANEVDEKTIQAAIEFSLKHLGRITALINEVKQAVAKPLIKISDKSETEETESANEKEKVIKLGQEFLAKNLPETLFGIVKGTKLSRKQALEKLKEELDFYLKEQQIGKEKRKYALADFDHYVNQAVVEAILSKGQRVDGRKLDEIRPLECEVGVLPRTHGSGLFNRGETQVLSIVTLGGPSLEQIVEGLEPEVKKRFMHHYYFPPYCVGEVKKTGVGRREIGHGALVEKALTPVLPSKEEFPYTIRVVSEVLGSNGSSSMASTCGSTLALMDAGVPITRPVAGIAIGLASDDSGKYKVLTDLQDLEDGKGGMDFKITRTEVGITAIQMDTKTKQGLTIDIIKDALTVGQKAITKVLNCIKKEIAGPRSELSPHAPRVEQFIIDPEKIREVIGPGGKIINEIIAKTGATVDIENNGSVTVCAVNDASIKQAVKWVKDIVREPEVGEIFTGKVTRLMDFGAFVEILPGKEGLVHISEIDWTHVNKVEDYLRIGDEVKVKVIEIDEQNRVNLSIKALKEKPAGYQDRPPRESRPFFNGPRDNRRDNRRGNFRDNRRSGGGRFDRRKRF